MVIANEVLLFGFPIQIQIIIKGAVIVMRLLSQSVSRKEKAARRRLVLRHCSCLFFDGVSGVPRCILNIARGIVGGSLGLIDLAFGFQVLITTELTGTFFDGAFCLVGSALYMFAIHDRVAVWIGHNESVAQWFLGETSAGLVEDF
jgi:hypothetical protein